MILKHWLVSLQQRVRFQSRPARRKSLRHRHLMGRAVPAQTEVLEDRLLLTNFVVTTLDDVIADDDVVSLREAIQSANNNLAPNDDLADGEVDGGFQSHGQWRRQRTEQSAGRRQRIQSRLSGTTRDHLFILRKIFS